MVERHLPPEVWAMLHRIATRISRYDLSNQYESQEGQYTTAMTNGWYAWMENPDATEKELYYATLRATDRDLRGVNSDRYAVFQRTNHYMRRSRCTVPDWTCYNAMTQVPSTPTQGVRSVDTPPAFDLDHLCQLIYDACGPVTGKAVIDRDLHDKTYEAMAADEQALNPTLYVGDEGFQRAYDTVRRRAVRGRKMAEHALRAYLAC